MNRLRIDQTTKGFEIYFKYDEQIVADIKSIKNSYWNGKGRFWFVPAYMEYQVEMLKGKYGIMISPVIQMPEQFGDIPALPDLKVALPLRRDLFHYQENGVAKGMEWGQFINGDAPGLGKTQQSIATAVGLGCKCILVICPNTLKYNWQNEWMMVAGRKSLVLGGDANKKNIMKWMDYYEIGDTNVFIINFESLKPYFIKAGWKKPTKAKDFLVKNIPLKPCVSLFDCIIVDEIHKCANPDTMQTKFICAIARNKPTVMTLTGTILVNKPKDIVGPLVVVNKLAEVVSHIPQPRDEHGHLTDFSGFTRFVNRYCNGGNGASNLRELKYRLRKVCYFRREKEEVLKDLPEKIRQIVLCDITNRAEYEQEKFKFINNLKNIKACNDPKLRKSLRGGMMVLMKKLLQIVAKGKLEAAQEHISEVVDSGQKIIIFYEHLDTLRELRELYPDAALVVGDYGNGKRQNVEERQANINRFQNDPTCNKILCSLKVGGVGTNLTAASDVLLISFGYTDAGIEQAFDRAHRFGQKNSVRGGILRGRNTIDDYVYDELIMKKRLMASEVNGEEIIEDNVVDGLLKFFDTTMKEVA